MIILKSNKLTQKNIEDIQTLEEQCKAIDGDKLLVYADEGDNIYPKFDCFYMMYDIETSTKQSNLPSDAKLLGFLSVFQPDGYCPYVYAMVDPKYRKQGIFKQLYEEFLDEFNYFKFESVSFPMYKDNETAIKILKKMEGYKYSTEYILELDLLSSTNTTKSKTQAKNSDNKSHQKETTKLSLTSSHNDDGTITYYLNDLALGHFKRTIGSLIITEDEGIACLSHFEIQKSKRNKGYGRKMLDLLCEELRNNNTNKIILQVTSNNPVALHLYTSYGFKIQSELDYYNIDYNVNTIN